MRALVIIFIVFILNMNSFGQIYLKFGASGNIINLRAYDKIIDNFNNSRPWLKKPMEKLNYLDGADIGLGLIIKRLFVDISFNFADKGKYAFDDSIGYQTRELMVRNNFMAFTLGAGFSGSSTFLGIGLMTQYGTINTPHKIIYLQ